MKYVTGHKVSFSFLSLLNVNLNTFVFPIVRWPSLVAKYCPCLRGSSRTLPLATRVRFRPEDLEVLQPAAGGRMAEGGGRS